VRLFTLRGPVLRVPWPLVILGWAGRLLWTWTRWLAVHRAVAGLLALAVVVVWAGWPWGGLIVGGLLMAAGTWLEARPARFEEWRRGRWYRRTWEDAMDGCGLVRANVVPVLEDVRVSGNTRDGMGAPWTLDMLTVRVAPGQLVSDWRAVQGRLASAWDLRRVRVHNYPGRTDAVQLACSRHRQLTPTVDQRRPELHPDAQPAVRTVLELVEPDDVSTPVEQPVDKPAGAFPRTPRGGAR
jgi:hypothetical protein